MSLFAHDFLCRTVKHQASLIYSNPYPGNNAHVRVPRATGVGRTTKSKAMVLPFRSPEPTVSPVPSATPVPSPLPIPRPTRLPPHTHRPTRVFDKTHRPTFDIEHTTHPTTPTLQPTINFWVGRGMLWGLYLCRLVASAMLISPSLTPRFASP